MKEGLAYLPTALALVLSLVLVPVLTLAMTPVDPAGPVVVVTAPSANPVHIIEASGGSVIGLENAPMGTLGFSAVPGFEETARHGLSTVTFQDGALQVLVIGAQGMDTAEALAQLVAAQL